MYSNLKIFNGTSSILDTTINSEGVFETSVYLEEVSTGLYESINLFFLEEVEYNGGTYLNKPVSETGTSSISFEWKEDNYDSSDIIIYGAKIEGGLTKIDVKDYYSINVLDNSTISSINGGVKVLNSLDNEAIQVNIALSSQIEGRHKEHF